MPRPSEPSIEFVEYHYCCVMLTEFDERAFRGDVVVKERY